MLFSLLQKKFSHNFLNVWTLYKYSDKKVRFSGMISANQIAIWRTAVMIFSEENANLYNFQ